MNNRVVSAETAATAIEDAAGGRSSRTRAPHATLEMLSGLPATAGYQLARRGKKVESANSYKPRLTAERFIASSLASSKFPRSLFEPKITEFSADMK